jgi:aryl-alcohol dehydrogenase-like predicted oxidoreductase
MWDRRTPVEETMSALDDQVRAGRVLSVGISDTPAWVVSRANTVAQWRGWAPLAGLQVPYSLAQRDIERELLPMAEASGMTVAVWSPLAGGILSGKYTRPGGPGPGTRIDPASLTGQQREIAATVQQVADDLAATPSQVALAWTMARSPAIHPIVGARRLDQLLDNLGALDVRLTAGTLARLESAAGFDPGFPAAFISDNSGWVFGAAQAD